MDVPNPKRSASASCNRPPSRPSTPLRPSSRTSLRDSQILTPKYGPSTYPLESLEPAFAEFSDSMADLEANFMHLQLMHESLSRFSESFASFLYGMNMNAFCVDFPEAPTSDSFRRAKRNEEHSQSAKDHVSRPELSDETFMTTDTSFVENPPSSRGPTKFATPAPMARPSSGPNNRGVGETQPRGGRGVGARGSSRGSGIARGKLMGTR